MMHKKEYNAARAIAMLLVVFGHAQVFSFGNAVWDFPMNPFRIHLDNVISFIYCFHVHLFFFVSGALFHTNGKKQNSSNAISFVKKKATRLLIPYFVCFVFLLLPVRLLVGFYPSNFTYSIKQILPDFIGFGDNGHLWFLPTLFIDYVLFYCIERLCKKRAVGILFSVTALYLLAYLIPDRFDVSIRYLLWFTAGYFFDMLYYVKLTRVKSNILFFTSVALLSGAYFLYSTGKYFQGTRVLLSIPITLFGVLSVVVFAYVCAGKQFRLFSFLERNSYSIYLIHDPVNYLFLFIIGKLISVSELSGIEYAAVIILKVAISLICALLINQGVEELEKHFKKTVRRL